MHQLSMLKAPSRSFGGELGLGRRKTRRPFSSTQPLHLILKTAENSPSLRRHYAITNGTIHGFAKKFGTKIYRLAIMRGHIHFLMKFTNAQSYRAFVRALTGQLSLKLKIKWRLRPFTRVLHWGRDFRRVRSYVLQNQLEAEGFIVYYRKGPYP